MTLAQRITFTTSASHEAPTILAIALASLLLLGAIGLVILLGGRPIPVAQAGAPPAAATPAALVKANDPACAAALAKARDTHAMRAEDAIAASTAMLRACQVR